TVEKILMYCYQYDPDSNSYVPVAMNIMKIGGLATLIILGIFLTLFWVRERRKKQSQNFDYN
ncbi:MAG: SCO family protein, partial [Balneola sp.]